MQKRTEYLHMFIHVYLHLLSISILTWHCQSYLGHASSLLDKHIYINYIP